MKKILGILCSPNVGGSGHKLLTRALEASKQRGAEIELVILKPYFSSQELEEKILAADGLIVETPVHWFNVSALAKELIDRVLWRFSGEPWEIEGIPLGVIATCNEDGANQAISQIVMPFNHCGFYTPPFSTLIHNLSMPNHGEDGWQNDAEYIGQQIADYAKQRG